MTSARSHGCFPHAVRPGSENDKVQAGCKFAALSKSTGAGLRTGEGICGWRRSRYRSWRFRTPNHPPPPSRIASDPLCSSCPSSFQLSFEDPVKAYCWQERDFDPISPILVNSHITIRHTAVHSLTLAAAETGSHEYTSGRTLTSSHGGLRTYSTALAACDLCYGG